LNDPQAIVSDAVADRAKSLTVNAADDFGKIAAIGKFVQGLQYVSIQTGTGRGGGYKPHTSSEVLAKAYGDCKDKANLMRAMLKAVGIVSYPVAIYSGDPDYVREEWPSPHQVNHVILAVALPPGKEVSSRLNHVVTARIPSFIIELSFLHKCQFWIRYPALPGRRVENAYPQKSHSLPDQHRPDCFNAYSSRFDVRARTEHVIVAPQLGLCLRRRSEGREV